MPSNWGQDQTANVSQRSASLVQFRPVLGQLLPWKSRLVSSVANTYLALAADRETLTLAQTTLAAQQSTYSMIKRRHDLGLATELDLQRAQTQVDSALGDVARFTQLALLTQF
jgi:outer membrane protein TolC